VGFDGLDGEALLLNLDLLGLAASNASACSANLHEPSHVLLAMGCSPADARSAIRFSFGPTNSDAEVDRATAIVVEAVTQLRIQDGGR
jgi:cysteine desulfurase